MTAFEHCTALEARIAKRLVADALAAGWSISVHDGEEWAIKQSTDKAAIYAAMCSTEMDTLRFRKDGEPIGSVTLIYGNGEDLVSDSGDGDELQAFLTKGRYF